MKHLIVTEDVNSLPKVLYDRVILDTTTNEIIYMNGELTYEVIPDSYIYNETDKKYYQKLVAYGNSNRIGLNSQWVSDTEDDKYSYFKSNSNVGVDDSYSQCKVTWSNLTSITFKYMSSSEMGYDYLCVGKLDGEKFTSLPSDGNSNVYLSTKGRESGTYYEFTIECDKGEHHIWFCYRKDSSGNKGEDRGFIGVPKSVVQILDVKQGSELPTEYKSGGISAEGGKTYNINYKRVVLPNGSYIGPFYEDYTKTEKTINYEYVDLGLPSGLKWAKCNIGATSEAEDGVFFQWGDISGVNGSLVGKYSDENYTWATAPFNNGSSEFNSDYFNTHKSEWLDDNSNLKPEFDAATQIMGNDWRMPTQSDFQELFDNTTNKWFVNYKNTGVNGWKFTSKTDTSKYIFIPTAGYCNNGSVVEVGDGGKVWSSSLLITNHYYACALAFYLGSCKISGAGRSYGMSVRGVRK